MALVVAGCCVFAAYQYNSSAVHSLDGKIYGTYWKISSTKYIDLDTQAKIKQKLNDIDLIASNYNANSELSKINQLNISETIQISKELNLLIETSEHINYQTKGLFNITLGIQTSKMGFGPNIDSSLVENNNKLMSELYDLETFLLTKNYLFHFDLSAIAKGYAVDEISKLLLENGYKNFVLDIGGELAIQGKKHNHQWIIAIQDPMSEDQQPIYIMNSEAPYYLATSGEYRNHYYNEEGQLITHTIDPRTSKSINGLNLSVTIKNDYSAMLADAYATALNIMDIEEGLNFANANNLQVMYITKDNKYFSNNWND